MRYNDMRVKVLRKQIDHVMDQLLKDDMDDVIDMLDHKLLGVVRQPFVENIVLQKCKSYLNMICSIYNVERC